MQPSCQCLKHVYILTAHYRMWENLTDRKPFTNLMANLFLLESVLGTCTVHKYLPQQNFPMYNSLNTETLII